MRSRISPWLKSKRFTSAQSDSARPLEPRRRDAIYPFPPWEVHLKVEKHGGNRLQYGAQYYAAPGLQVAPARDRGPATLCARNRFRRPVLADLGQPSSAGVYLREGKRNPR